MNKRRRTSSANSREEDDNESQEDETQESPAPLSRKKKKLDPTELCQQIYDSIKNYKKEDGSMLCDVFIRAPKRRQEPSYYDVVANPIDLLKVQQKIKTDSYEDIEELTTDVELIVNNAKAFYKPDSSEYADACLLWDVFNTNKKRILESNSVEESQPGTRLKMGKLGRPRKTVDGEEDSDEEFDSFEELFATVMTAKDPIDDRLLHFQFQLLPSKKLYPDYYDVIDHPIDLRFIANKIQTNAYTSLGEMEKDFLQMTKNACTFNETGSQIYKDAKQLKKIFTTRKAEIELGRYKKPILKKGQNMSASIAALKKQVESSDEEMDESMETEGDGPLWQLFDQLYNTANTNDNNAVGSPLGESLWKLPNRRFHPEYYELIKKPISMAQIRNKLKKGSYSNITDMTAELYLMLDNAKKAFPISHKTHKDAIKMQKLLNQKLIDNGDLEDTDTEDTDSSSLPGALTSPNTSLQATPITQTPIAAFTVEKKKKGRPRLNPLPANTISGTPTTPTIVMKGRPPNPPTLKKKLLTLQQYLVDYTLNGRQPMALFMEKPSKKLYPDYYQVIQHPIDMNTIEQNIKGERYNTLDDVVGDFRLMFSNCRKYNEEGSMIYEDANLLERVLNEKLKEFSGITYRKITGTSATPKLKTYQNMKKRIQAPPESKLRQLYDAIRDYREPKQNRQLALIFMKLPSKNKKDYPDYYDIIKQPIDMERIAQKLKQNSYETVDEIADDFMLMFGNACKYNEPDSQIYKDALNLQQVCIQTKQQLKVSDEIVPDVPQAVQELLLSLFTSFYNFQDDEGRCYSDSLAELPEYDENDGNKVRAISLDLIKRRLDKGLYKRLDIFQEDIFACLERARKLSRTDSQVFEDSIELQSFFIRKRDELCKNGEILSSPALIYNSMHLSANVEALRQSKLLQEEGEGETENDAMGPSQGESMTIDQKVFSPGDFVYYELQDNKIPGILYIERLWTNSDNVKMMYGNLFLRPYETYHVQTRRFLEQEVFKSDQHQAIPLSQAQNKCFVMNVKDYFKLRPEGFLDKDVYVCESRYNSRARSFKKIKTWNCAPANDPVKLIPRETPLELKRVMSVFKERVEKHKVELSELQLQEAIVEKEKPNVVVFVHGGEEGNIYYEQYNTVCSGSVKTGDYVYVATEAGKQSIAQINAIWETKDGKSFFRGPWLLTPLEVPGTINRLFYRQEILLSTVQETTPTVGIVGRCAVLEFHEYITRRPTEIPESDVYVCESVYDEMKKQIRRIPTPGGLRKFTHTQMVLTDEVYHFRRAINPPRVSCGEIAALLEKQPIPSCDMDFIKTEGTDLYTEDSMDGGPSSVCSDLVTASPIPNYAYNSTPVISGKRGKTGKKLVTGYILYSSEHRKGICASHPDAKFGDVSRMVGNEWRSLPSHERQIWEDKAARLNEENAAKYAAENIDNECPSPNSANIQQAIVQEILPNQVYECCWDKCDWQFEDPADCLEHCIADGVGCVHKYFANIPQNEHDYICIWRGCIRMKRNCIAFPHLARLVKHVREVHILKSGGRIVQPHNRSKNFVPAKRTNAQIQSTLNTIHSTINQQSSIQSTATATNIQTTTQYIPSNQNNSNNLQNSNIPVYNFVSAPPAEPLFVTVPPRPQRVLHSEAYLKYIEGIQNNTPYITPWDKTLKASQETVSTDISRLPVNWLGKHGKEKPEEIIDAVWELRDFMMKDILQFKDF
uniref:Putative chromatin remodeling complex rsc subunit rsc1/polybromo n=1 Tax=Corethrella appendiculata TaxID=1370023 RepID=W4VRH5_9DIPT